MEKARFAAAPAFLSIVSGISRAVSTSPAAPMQARPRNATLLPSRSRADVWPDWRQTPVSDTAGDQLAALWASGMLLAFVLFVTLVSLEWFLRRRWGMV